MNVQVDKFILLIKGNEDQEIVAKILYKNGYTIRQITVTPKNSKTKVKALEYCKGD